MATHSIRQDINKSICEYPICCLTIKAKNYVKRCQFIVERDLGKGMTNAVLNAEIIMRNITIWT